jgi:hypothetical protein
MSAVARVAALKKVDLPVLGLPTTPRRREYEVGMVFLCLGYVSVAIFVFFGLSVCSIGGATYLLLCVRPMRQPSVF